MKPIRIIFSDLDGTLFYNGPEGSRMNQENEEAIRRWTACGNRFVIATGRPSDIRKELMEHHQIECDILACNGAKVILDEEVLWSKEIGPEEIREIMTLCEPYGQQVDFALDMDWIEWVVLRRYGLVETQHPDAVFHTIVEEYIAQEREVYPNKIFMVCANPETRQSLMTTLHKVFDGRLSITSSGQDNIELGCLGVGKDKAVEEILCRLNLEKSQAAAIGDEMNDLAMLKCLPYGFAMSSAREEIRQQVPYEIGSVSELIDWCLDYNKSCEEEIHTTVDL